MALFNRQNQNENDEELARKKEIPDRKFKDLNPQNKKRRKEPTKPWGRQERFFILFILVATILTSAFLAASARNWKLPGLPRISFPSFNLFKEETITLGSSQDQREKTKQSENSIKVMTSFKELTKSLSGVYGLYVVNLKSGFSYGVNQSEVFTAASLIKLPVLTALYRQAEEGKINLETKYTLKETDKIGGSGSLQYKPAGTVLTYRQLAQFMASQSDNTAFGIIKKIVGEENITSEINRLGMNKTSLIENETSPEDIGLFFNRLWRDEIVSSIDKEEIFGFLTKTSYEDWLAAGIPKGIKVAHKYGREVHVVNDAGIVFTDEPFVLVLMSKGVVEREADMLIPQLAKMVYEQGSLDK